MIKKSFFFCGKKKTKVLKKSEAKKFAEFLKFYFRFFKFFLENSLRWKLDVVSVDGSTVLISRKAILLSSFRDNKMPKPTFLLKMFKNTIYIEKEEEFWWK